MGNQASTFLHNDFKEQKNISMLVAFELALYIFR